MYETSNFIRISFTKTNVVACYDAVMHNITMEKKINVFEF